MPDKEYREVPETDPEVSIERDEKHRYLINGEHFPSVTQIISATVPKQLSWWGQTVGVKGVMTLIDRGYDVGFMSAEEITAALTTEKITVNHTLGAAGQRGTDIHSVIEGIARGEEGLIKDLPTEQALRIVAFKDFMDQCEVEVLESEKMTYNLVDRYAGQFDLRVQMGNERILIDIKTGKKVYPESMFPQLEAYEQAERVSFGESTDRRAILLLPEDGTWELVYSSDTYGDFELLHNVYRGQTSRKVRVKASKKAGDYHRVREEEL